MEYNDKDIFEQIISMDKKYKIRRGHTVRVLCVDATKDDYPVVALVYGEAKHYRKNGSTSCFYKSDLDLIEVSEYDDFKIDDPVMVKDTYMVTWLRRHFAGLDDCGVPRVFAGGITSWSSLNNDDVQYWDQIRKPTEEELKTK